MVYFCRLVRIFFINMHSWIDLQKAQQALLLFWPRNGTNQGFLKELDSLSWLRNLPRNLQCQRNHEQFGNYVALDSEIKSAWYGRPAWTINKAQLSTSGSGSAYRHLNRKQTESTLLVVTDGLHSLHDWPNFVVVWFLPAAEQEADSQFPPVSSFAWLLIFILCVRKSNKQNEML